MVSQPLDTIMNQLHLTNAQLVNASTEQLSFKMLQKGRKGDRLSPRMQDKILRALLTVKPDLKIRRRDLFRYDPSEAVVEKIKSALTLVGDDKIKYPEFIDLLAAAGINRYAVEPNRSIFYGPGGEAHVEEGEASLSPITGVTAYQVNVRDRKIKYEKYGEAHKESIPLTGSSLEKITPPAETTPTKSEPSKKKTIGKTRIRKTGKFVKKHRTKKKNYSRGRI